MNTKISGKWLVDLENCTCQNTENQIVIIFEKIGPALRGKIKEIPYTLRGEGAQDPAINKIIKKSLIEADEVFFKEYFAEEIKRKYDYAELTV